MNTHAMRIFLVLGLMFVSGHAMAIPVLDQYLVLFSHGGTTLGSGLTITAHTTETAKLFVGGGYTIKCDSSSLELKDENKGTTVVFQPLVSLTIKVPIISPKSYGVPGWSSIPPASCTQCAMHHRWEAADSTDTSISVGLLGTGVNFTLVPTGEVGWGETEVLTVCRPGTPQCCTPGCSLP